MKQPITYPNHVEPMAVPAAALSEPYWRDLVQMSVDKDGNLSVLMTVVTEVVFPLELHADGQHSRSELAVMAIERLLYDIQRDVRPVIEAKLKGWGL